MACCFSSSLFKLLLLHSHSSEQVLKPWSNTIGDQTITIPVWIDEPTLKTVGLVHAKKGGEGWLAEEEKVEKEEVDKMVDGGGQGDEGRYVLVK